MAYDDYVTSEVFLTNQKSWPYLTSFRSKHNVFCTRNHSVLYGLGKDPSQKKKKKKGKKKQPPCLYVVYSDSQVTRSSGENQQNRFMKVLKLKVRKTLSWERSKDANEFPPPRSELAAFPILAY